MYDIKGKPRSAGSPLTKEKLGSLDKETLDMIKGAELLPRTISEIIRDTYFDRLFDRILSSPYKGQVRILCTGDLDTYIWRDQEIETPAGEYVLHLIAPNEEELHTVLGCVLVPSERGKLETVTSWTSRATILNLYFPL